MTALGALVAADPHEQSRWSPAEGFMAEFPRHGVPRNTLAPALVAPLVRRSHLAGNHGTIRGKELSGRLQTKAVKTAESSQVRALKGSVEHEGLAVENEI